VIRPATVKDIPSIVKVRLAAISEKEIQGFSTPELGTYSSNEEREKVWLGENRLKDGSEIIVAEKHGKTVGFIVLQMKSNCGYIDNE
jgi:hypothetical protein